MYVLLTCNKNINKYIGWKQRKLKIVWDERDKGSVERRVGDMRTRWIVKFGFNTNHITVTNRASQILLKWSNSQFWSKMIIDHHITRGGSPLSSRNNRPYFRLWTYDPFENLKKKNQKIPNRNLTMYLWVRLQGSILKTCLPNQ